MEKQQLLVTVLDDQKMDFLLKLFAQLDFISVEEVPADQPEPGASKHNILDSAGIWEGRDITAEQLRQQAYLRRTVNYDEKS